MYTLVIHNQSAGNIFSYSYSNIKRKFFGISSAPYPEINTVQHSDPLLFQELFSTDQLDRVLCYRSPCSFIRVGNSLFATSLTKNERFARKPKSEFPTLSLIHIKEIQYSYIQYRRFNIIDPKLGVNNISAL